MSLFGSKKVSTYTLSIALKSSSIDIQLISQTSKSIQKQVIFTQRKIIVLSDSQNSHLYTKQCLSELSSLLKSSIKEINQLCNGILDQTQVVLYAPWFTSHITSLSHKEPVIITEKFLYQQLYTIETPNKLINLEKKIVKILTNGYAVNELTRSKLNNISLDVYSSYISDSIYNSINDVLRKSIPFCSKNISYTTSSILLFSQIKRFLVREDNISFIYVGGEITELGIIEDDALSFYATFPIGKHDFLREVQTQITSYDYDLLYQKQVQIKSKTKQAQFEELKKQWGIMVLSTLMSFKKDVPSKLLVISDSKTKEFFTENLIAQLKETSETAFGHYRIINFDISHLKDIILYKTSTHANELDMQLEALI